MKKSAHPYIYTLILALCTSCSVNKFIPENQYLLDEVKIVSDTKEVKPSLFNSYLRQNPNAKWFNMVKIPMYIYGASGTDSTKRVNRFFRKIGDAPVIYNADVAMKSKEEIEKAVRNMGYIGAKVTIHTEAKKNKLKLFYHIEAGRPYMIRHIAYNIDDLNISDCLQQDSAQSMLFPGMPFDVNVLDAERQRITRLLQNKGYYKFNKDFLVYQADTTRNTYLVDLTLKLLPYQRKKEDPPQKHRQYLVNSVNFIADSEMTPIRKGSFTGFDSLSYKGYNMYYKDKMFLRPKLLVDFNRIRPGEFYSERDVQNTYSALGRLRMLKYSNIRFKEVNVSDSTKLDAYIVMSKGQNKSVSFEIEGTNSAGDLGAAASISFQHRNVFKGSETFTMKVRGAYEAITGLGQDYVNDNYTEYGVESSLNFPEFMFPFLSSDFKRKIKATSEVGLKFTSQVRPEFSRMLASASWSYRWSDRKHIQHRLDLADINYVYMPSKSPDFQEYLDKMTANNSLLRASYENVLIVRMGYNFTYNSAGNTMMRTPTKSSYSLRVNVEEAGNLMYAASKLAHSTPKGDKGFVLANIPFAQYIKGDFDFAKNFMIDPRNSFVFHIGVGVAYPYGNSRALPFEKRYFSGGANSVRGWSVRSLGPGGYKGSDGQMDFIKQSGDIKLDLNVEYRTHLFWKLNGAAFIDAGNIWTIRSDSEQEDGVFKFNKFYKQIAVAYGLGIRFDLDYLILRFDGGMKAINPMETGKGRYPITRPRFSRDFAFHFAVGYPF
jgi:outer membrane protein assembly factor BamA